MMFRRKASNGVPVPASTSEPNDKPVFVQVPRTFERARPAPDANDELSVIGEILERESECPTTFKLKARVAGYYPQDLSQAVIRACLVCEESYVKALSTLHIC